MDEQPNRCDIDSSRSKRDQQQTKVALVICRAAKPAARKAVAHNWTEHCHRSQQPDRYCQNHHRTQIASFLHQTSDSKDGPYGWPGWKGKRTLEHRDSSATTVPWEQLKISPRRPLAFWGDGDEIAAIEEVEERFGVKLDTSTAASWLRFGDVFAALQRALPPNEEQTAETWRTS